MTFDRILQIITIVFGAGGVLSFILSVRRTNAQNTLDLSSAWEKFSAPLMNRLEDLEARVLDQEGEIDDLRAWANKLVAQINTLGGVPVPFSRRKSEMGDKN